MKTLWVRVLPVLACAYLQSLFAAPAAPIEFELTQPDGTTFTAVARGDEYANWTETLDGHSIVKVGDTWYYAERGSAGQLRAGTVAVGELNAIQRRQLPRHLAPEVDPAERETRTIRPLKRLNTSAADGLELPQTISHTQYVLTILVNYNNISFTYSDASFQDLMYGASDSVRDYYLENSYGGFTITPPVETYGTANDGIIHVNRPVNHPNQGNTGSVSRAEARAIVQLTNSYVDYSDYDANSDGVVSADELSIVIILAGYETSFGGAALALTPNVWGHQAYFSIPLSLDGVSLQPYTMFGERHGTASGTHQATIGIMAHELGHLMLGLPDLYDYDGSSAGIGDWGLMASGNWNRTISQQSGETPAHLSAWSKVVTNFTLPQDINSNQNGLAIDQAATNEEAKRIWIDKYKINEYFLLENRQQTGFDAALPGNGLLIWHIDEGAGSNDDETHKWVDLEEADGLAHLDTNTNDGNDGDPFKSNTGRTTFNNGSNPDSRNYAGVDTGIAVTGVSTSGATMMADITVSPFVLGDHVRYDALVTGGAIGYNNPTAWLGLNTLNDTGFSQLDGVDVFVTDSVGATIEFRYYTSLAGGVPTGLIHTQAGIAAGPGWNRILLNSPQSFPLGAERGIVLKIVNNSDGYPVSVDTSVTASGRSYVDSNGTGTFSSLCPSFCGDLNLIALFSGGNTEPGFTPGSAVARQQGSPAGAAVAVGTVSDTETPAGALTVTQVAGGTATGITVTGISNTDGTITAALAASCSATSGTVRFQVSDGSLTGTGDLQVNVSANSQPTLSYGAKSINFGDSSTHAALTGPSDNGTVNSVSVQGAGTYTGTISVNPAGLVSLSNAQPAGTHSITIRATDNCGAMRDANFQLQVDAVLPGAPVIGTAATGNTEATVSFTPPVSDGGAAITSYTATSSPGNFTGTAAGSPITVTGLSNGQAYTFTVTATNSVGEGPASAVSNAVTPAAPQTISFDNPGPQDIGTAPTLSATATSGLPVSFTSTTQSVCTITSGGALTFVATGNCSIDANQSGNAAWLAAPTVTQVFAVQPVLPDAPAIGVATAGDMQATISFTAPGFDGGADITSYTVTSSPEGLTASGAASPITVSGLTNGQAYTFTVVATNSVGDGPASAPSNEVVPLVEEVFKDGFE